MRIQQRIAITFTLLATILVLVVNLIEYYFANQNTFEDFYKRLEIRAIVAARTAYGQEQMGKIAYEELRQQHLEKLPDEREYFIEPQQFQQSSLPSELLVRKDFTEDIRSKGKARYRSKSMFYYGYLYRDKSGDHLVVVSARNEFIEAYLINLRNNIIISIAFTIVLALLAGFWFSSLVLKPLRTITAKMQEIGATQLHLRLKTGKGKDEISELSATFNNMLDRLEATFETQKNFISNASHELNTPLTSIIGESEYVLAKDRSPEEYRNALTVVLTEAERLRKITNSLLQLAQTGYNGKNQEFEQLRIDEIIYGVKATVDNIVPDNKVYINHSLMPEDEDKLVIKGNAQLLELAIANIVINGCKYSSNKPVQVTIAAAYLKVIVIVEDEGIGIPWNELDYIYEPFFRASNTSRFNGYGIGLPLARNIIRMHNGTLDVTSVENVGTRIKITLPLYVP